MTPAFWRYSQCVVIFLILMMNHASSANEEGLIISFERGNWAGDECTKGGLDSGLAGDMGALVISGNREMGYPPLFEFTVDLPEDLSSYKTVLFTVCYRCNSMQTPRASLFWNGVHLTDIDAFGSGEELKNTTVEIRQGTFNLAKGKHILRISAEDTINQWDYFELDALKIAPPSDPVIKGGVLIPYEIIPMTGANWAGDGGTWGGLDADANLTSDRAAIIVKSESTGFPTALEYHVKLSSDFTCSSMRVTIGLRRNQRMVKNGEVYWDGKLLASCHPYLETGLLNGRDSLLGEVTITCASGEYNFSPGEHTIKLSVLPSEPFGSLFQIDSILLESIPDAAKSTKIYLEGVKLAVNTLKGNLEKEALSRFVEAVNRLGLTTFGSDQSDSQTGLLKLHLGTAQDDPAIKKFFESGDNSQSFSCQQPYQQREGYIISYETSEGERTLYAGGQQPMGTVYAISDLQLRLRKNEKGVYLDFPEANGKDKDFQFVFAPQIEIRGEYMNIGYNHRGITPHEWDQERWHTYIDQLVLARLNRFYFYIWNDVYTLYPESTYSKEPLNRQIHENIRDMIDYAHTRGIQVTYMMCPTYFPKDIWLSHPEIHAEIEYVDHGFPAVCPRSPGAWELMKKIAKSEMEWFSKADSLQIWFYDPGGCWCTKHGCYQNQAENLALQVKEFFDIFRQLNPKATLEYNIWPIWLWEDRLGIKYREDLGRRIRDLPDSVGRKTTAVGASDNDVTLPLLEKQFGFDGTAFIFGANPESGYDFLIPHLTYLKETAQRIRESHVNGAFGHRLEAWTRFAATFFMGEYLWNPDASREEIVSKYANWITTNDGVGILFAEAILLLDKFTYDGADPHIGSRMSGLTQEAFDQIPETCKANTEYFPAMMEALAVIGRSVGVEDNASLSALADKFGFALETSPTFLTMASDKKYLFDKYRNFLLRGWKNGPF